MRLRIWSATPAARSSSTTTSGFRSLAVRTDRAVVDEGRAGAHVTAAGEDVSGFKFVTFDNGLTLYFEAGLDL